MREYFLTDFIKNRYIQCILVIGIVLDLISAHSLTHVAILFSIPYCTSVLLVYLLPQKKVKIKARISAQYKKGEIS